MALKKFKFTATLEPIKTNVTTAGVLLPLSLMRQLPQERLRVKGTINGAPFSLGIQFRKESQSFLIISRALQRAAGINIGSQATIEFHIVDQNKVELPEEFEAVLDQDDEAKRAWQKLTAGAQRSLCHYVFSVKNVDSRITRSLYILGKVKSGAYNKPVKEKSK